MLAVNASKHTPMHPLPPGYLDSMPNECTAPVDETTQDEVVDRPPAQGGKFGSFCLFRVPDTSPQYSRLP